ncbi:uncharacterized protein DS421_2g53590 [Arachis hypogaea]|nr:uncharacterized protein DS421_2g53590 [Arachis hypogaea]
MCVCMALVPQFLFLAMLTGLVEEGWKKLFQCYAYKFMRNFAESFKHLVIGIGKLECIVYLNF